MTKQTTIVLSIALSFMFLFSAIGYSSLTDALEIEAAVKYEMPSALAITSIVVESTSNVEHYEVTYIKHTTTVDALIDKKDDTTTTTSGRPGRPGTTTTTTYTGTVVCKITVYNNTEYEYAYRGLYYQSSLSGYNGNPKVSEQAGDSNLGVVVSFENNDRVVAPGEYLTFTVTYTVGKKMDDSTDWKTLLNFQFGINVESEIAAVDALHSKFLDILNTSSTYNTLYDAIDDKFDGAQEWTSNYIGNVSDAVDADSYVVETLFAGQLNMLINGVVTPATVLIKHENLDNNVLTGDSYTVKYNNSNTPTTYYGCEMTLYLTIDPLTTKNGQAPVYVTVFTCDSDENGNVNSDWYKIGETYIGKAPIVGYKGESGGTGSFVTDNWVSDRATYKVTDRYSYTVNQGTTIKDLTRVVDQNAINEFQLLISDAKELIDDMRYAGIGIEMIEEAYEYAASYYYLDDQGSPVAISGTTRTQLLPIIKDLDYAVSEARRAIEELANK